MQKMQKTQVQSLGQEDPLEEEMATCSSILAWKNYTDRGSWQATVQGVSKSWTWLSTHTLYLHDFKISCLCSPLKLIEQFQLPTDGFNCLLMVSDFSNPTQATHNCSRINEGFPGGPVVKNLPCNAGDTGLIPSLGIYHMPWGNYAQVPQLPSLHSGAWEPQLLKPYA